MANRADEDALADLHNKVAQTLSKALDGTPVPEFKDEETGAIVQEAGVIPPSAALITATIQFLKNNNITCAPSKDNAMGEITDKLAGLRTRREARALAREELKDAAEQGTFLRGLNS